MQNDIIVKSENNYSSLFTQRNYKKNEIIFNCKDVIYIDKPTKYSIQVNTDSHIESANKNIDIPDESIFWCFLNHSCNPNCTFNTETLSLIAIKDIKKGEELTFNYNTTEYDMSTPFVCNCLSDNCVKRVAGYKYLNAKQKEGLIPYLAEHIISNEDEFVTRSFNI